MIEVLLTGWNPGFDKIAMNRLLRAQFDYSLAEAKIAVDAILERQEIILTVQPEILEQITFELVELGAVFTIIKRN